MVDKEKGTDTGRRGVGDGEAYIGDVHTFGTVGDDRDDLETKGKLLQDRRS